MLLFLTILHLSTARCTKYIMVELMRSEKGTKEEELWSAAYRGDNQTIEPLIDKGVDINAKNKDSMNALMLACRAGHREVAELLTDKGVDINSKPILV